MLPMNRKSGRYAPTGRRWRVVQAIVGGMLGAVFVGALMPTAMGSVRAQENRTTPTPSAGPPCGRPFAGSPILVTADCDDPRYNDPFIDVEECRDTPVPHRYVHGGFTGTDARFSFAFPPREQYQERFFQFTHQSYGETLRPNDIAFAVATGAYLVQTNQGGAEALAESTTFLSPSFDGSAHGYRVNAAAAKYSRLVAAQNYGQHRPFGYLTGPSGGGLQTKASMENSIGVWDGAVPHVTGTPMSMAQVVEVWGRARRVLDTKFPSIIDALEPGGDDMFAGLNAEERAALAEATQHGFPPRAWFHYVPMSLGLLARFVPDIRLLDPTYVDDFWTKPGYEGTDPTSSIATARVEHEATVVEVLAGTSTQLRLSSVPIVTGNLALTLPDLVLMSGAAEGHSVVLGTVDPATDTVGFARGADTDVVSAIKSGDRVRIDNSWGLAAQTHYRHQLPERGSHLDHPIYDQFWSADGTPLYPQRERLLGPTLGLGATGGVQTGRFNGKIIYVQNLLDGHAPAWQADWYRRTAERAWGRRHLEDNFRLWYTDHAVHSGQADPARIINYRGVIEQALRDLSVWVEKDVPPPASTRYQVVDGQVEVPESARSRRGGIQPVVELKANGWERAEVKVGQPVTFTAKIEVPPNTGEVVAAEWDFLGVGDYPTAEPLRDPSATVTLTRTFSFSQPGTYFPVLRATSQREGDPDTPYGRIRNLGRARVVVMP